MCQVRLQLMGEMQKAGAAVSNQSGFTRALTVVKTEGFRGLYKGLTASLARQVFCTLSIHSVFQRTFFGIPLSPPPFIGLVSPPPTVRKCSAGHVHNDAIWCLRSDKGLLWERFRLAKKDRRSSVQWRGRGFRWMPMRCNSCAHASRRYRYSIFIYFSSIHSLSFSNICVFVASFLCS